MKYTGTQADNKAYIKLANHLLANKLDTTHWKVRDKILNTRRAKNRDSKDYYPCIEFNWYNKIDDIIKSVYNEIEKPINFLDVGCGMGNIMHYVNQRFSLKNVVKRVDGIEREKLYYKVFKDELLLYFNRRRYLNFYNIDAFKFTNYDRYDLIYMYVPIRNSSKMQELHEFIAKKAKKGAYITDVGKAIKVKETNLEYAQIPYTWKKV